MADKIYRQPVVNFAPGLVQLSNPLLLSPGMASDLNNVNCHDAPVLAVREGTTAFYAEPSDSGVALAQLRLADGTYQLIFGYGSTGTLYYYDGSATPASIGSMTANSQIYSVMFPSADKIIFGDGTLMYSWDGASFTAMPAAVPALTCLEVHLSKLFGVKDRVKVYYSATNDPEDYTTTNDAGYLTLDNPTGDSVTAIKSFGTELYIWTQSAMYVLLGDTASRFTLQTVHSGAGCWTHFSVVDVNNALYWYGPAGIWEYTMRGTPNRISDEVIDDLLADVDTNRSDEICAGAVYNRQYRLSLPGLTTDCTVRFDTKHRSFFVDEDVTFTRMLNWRRP